MKKFNLFGQVVEYDDDFEFYNEYRKKFSVFSQEAVDEVENFLKDTLTIESLIDKFPNVIGNKILECIDFCIGELYKIGIINIDADTFLNKYWSYVNFDDIEDELEKRYRMILDLEEVLESERNMIKQSRMRWQGGGFGIKGALKGAAQAKMLNMGSDFLHSFGDASRKMSDSIEIKNKKSDLLEEYRKGYKLQNSAIHSIRGCFDGFMNELHLNDVVEKYDYNQRESKSIFKNVIRYEENEEEFFKKNIDCISMYPYTVDFYERLLYLDPYDSELNELAKYVGIDKDPLYLDYKVKALEYHKERNTFNGIVYENFEEKQKNELIFTGNAMKMLDEVKEDIDNSLNLNVMTVEGYIKCMDINNAVIKDYDIYMTQNMGFKSTRAYPLYSKNDLPQRWEIEHNYWDEILKDTDDEEFTRAFNKKLDYIQSFFDYMYNYEVLKYESELYEDYIYNNAKIPDDNYIPRDSKSCTNITGIIIFCIASFLALKFTGGIIRIIIIACATLWLIGVFLCNNDAEKGKTQYIEKIRQSNIKFKQL